MKYLIVLSLLFVVGCSAVPGKTGAGYHDFAAADKDGVMRVHRVYDNGHQEWLTPSEAAAR